MCNTDYKLHRIGDELEISYHHLGEDEDCDTNFYGRVSIDCVKQSLTRANGNEYIDLNCDNTFIARVPVSKLLHCIKEDNVTEDILAN